MGTKPRQFTPAICRIFGSQARTKLLAVLVERREEWFTAAELCTLADVSESGVHRDHKSLLLDYGLVDWRDASDTDRTSPRYTLADTEQAEYVTNLHYALESQLENSGGLLEGNVRQFAE